MKTIIIFYFTLLSGTCFSQDLPVKWTFEAQPSQETQGNYDLVFHAEIEEGYHLYASYLPSKDDGPLPTEIVFNELNNVTIEGEIKEGVYITEMDEAFQVEVNYFVDEANFHQKVTVQDDEAKATVTGMIYYMVCNESSCIPYEQPFRFLVQLHK